MLDWLFGKPYRVDKLDKSPQPGQRWLFKGDSDDPFGAKDLSPVKILEVKDGWVRYYMGTIFPDERRTVDSFVRMYQRVE